MKHKQFCGDCNDVTEHLMGRFCTFCVQCGANAHPVGRVRHSDREALSVLVQRSGVRVQHSVLNKLVRWSA